jgi:methyltransferase (TIGR00027 family)
MSRYRTSTAGFTCFTRACATREEEPFRGPDHMAEIFLPGFASLILNVPLLRRVFMHKVAPAGIYEYVMVRTRIFDAAFVKALQEGFPQIVILGAGMDTRALRFAQTNHGTRVFELDLPKVQEPKLDILWRNGIAFPDELTFVPIDFNHQDMGKELARAGYRKDRQTLFTWEGICMYLQAEAVDQTLAFIRSSAGSGSRMVMDYVRAAVLRGGRKYYGESQICATVSGTGEGWTFGIEEDKFPEFLAERGFKLEQHYTPLEMEKAFLTAPDGSLFGRVNGTHCIAEARLV